MSPAAVAAYCRSGRKAPKLGTHEVRFSPMSGVTHDGEKWSNAEADVVALVPYDPRWPSLFEAEDAALRRALPASLVVGIEHVGSTSVVDMESKPIVDIDLRVRERGDWPALFAPLRALEYVHWVDPAEAHILFVKGMPPFGNVRTHHVHVFAREEAYQARLRFRDWLRAHPIDARAYEALKRELAQRHADDRDAYARGKSRFVAEIEARALLAE